MKTMILGIAHVASMALPLSGAEPPAKLLSGLASEEFREREDSQVKLQQWAEAGKKEAAKEIFRLSAESEDPEIRQRCARILRSLSDLDYLSGGKGFLGITMLDEIAQIKGDEKPRAVIRILMVVEGSPASIAGLKAGDAVIGLEDEVWRNGNASEIFKEKISAKKPLDEVKLHVKKQDGEIVELKVALARNPIPDLLTTRGNLKFLDEQARDQHFKLWLKELDGDRP